jgi:PhnO protein
MFTNAHRRLLIELMTRDEISIRKALPNDFDKVYAFICELENTSFDNAALKKIFNLNLLSDNNIYLVATVNDAIIGYVSCHGQYLLHHGGLVGEIQEMFVQADQRNLGIGKLLLRELYKLGLEKNMLQLEVTSNNIRTATHRFYTAQGFEATHKKFILTLGS